MIASSTALGRAMFEDKTRVLLAVPQGVLDRARVFAGEATSRLKRPVSLQMVLRSLIDEGLKRTGDRAVFANIEAQVQAVRQIRSRVGRVGVEKTGPPRPAK
ncbi:MAG TPA: hypothetical protein VEL48_09970 [Candidatus Acidoferrales bacterium]|nr:hypothetical protein [Candidatus Acidoferrales bacterium]